MQTLEHAERLMREGAFQSAKTLLEKFISEDPDDLRAICDVGIAYTEIGENEKAIKALEYCIKNDDKNTYAWEALGCSQFRLGRLDDARQSLIQAIEIMPENASALRNLGILCGIMEMHDQELALLQKSMRINPGDYRTLFALNYAFRDAGKSEERCKIIDRLAEMDLPDEVLQEVDFIRILLALRWE